MNARVNFVLDQLQKNAQNLIVVGGVLSFVLVPILGLVFDIPINLTTLVVTTAILYIVAVILYYSNKAKKEVTL